MTTHHRRSCNMLHEVKILNPQGKIKKLISVRELERIHWKKFNDATNGITIGRFSKRLARRPGSGN